jgi:hypothetical protein
MALLNYESADGFLQTDTMMHDRIERAPAVHIHKILFIDSVTYNSATIDECYSRNIISCSANLSIKIPH